MSPMRPRDEEEVIYLNSIEDIEEVFKKGRLSEIMAVLQEPELKDLWRLPDGQRLLALLPDRTDLPKRQLRTLRAAMNPRRTRKAPVGGKT